MSSGSWRAAVELAASYLAWRDLLPLSACCALLLGADVGHLLRRAAFAGPASGLPASDGALRWLAMRVTRFGCKLSTGVGLEVLKLSDTVCRHTDVGAAAVSSVCAPLRVLHFHSGGAARRPGASAAGLTSAALDSILGCGRLALARVVLHGPAITDEALRTLGEGCPLLGALWLSCADRVSAAGLVDFVERAAQLRDVRLDGLSCIPGAQLMRALVARPLACALVADCCPELPILMGGLEVSRWTSLQRLGILFEPGCVVAAAGPARFLDSSAGSALGRLPRLRALAFAHVWAGDEFALALGGSGSGGSGGSSPLCALSLEGAHGISRAALSALVHALCPKGGGSLEELHVTATPSCGVDDAALAEWASMGIEFVSLEGAQITRDGIRGCGLRALRVKSCGDLQVPAAPVMASPAGRQLAKDRPKGATPGAQADAGRSAGPPPPPDLRVLTTEQALCYWWGKGYRYDEHSWYGLEHLGG